MNLKMRSMPVALSMSTHLPTSSLLMQINFVPFVGQEDATGRGEASKSFPSPFA